MIDEHQDVHEQQPQEKLAASHEQLSDKAVQNVSKLLSGFSLISSSMASFLLSRLRYLWHRDSAHKVLMIALAFLLIAGLVFGTFATIMLFHLSELFIRNNSVAAFPQQAPPEVTPQGTVDFHPTFPRPGGGQGSTASSLPPMGPTPSLQNTPSITPTVIVQPTPPQQGGQLTLQITSISTQVSNNSFVPVQVAANEPGVTVQLYVTYNVPPGYYSSQAQTTDGSGNATLSWVVSIFTFGRRQTVARVVAIGRDQDGQQASSQVVTVQVVGGF
jgi:hypothetical protein